MSVNNRYLLDQYEMILLHYLDEASEEWLHRGYELARQAMADDFGILDLATAHHQALRGEAARQTLSGARLQLAAEFFAECLSPFEMSHRGAKEGTRALRHLNEVLENELKRVAHALHDEAGQMLATVHIAVAALSEALPPENRHHIDDVTHLLRQIEMDLRGLSHEMRPTMLDNLGLLPALEFLAAKVSQRTSLSISVEGDSSSRLPMPIETALYRIVQVALNNVVKHAQANSARIKLTRSPACIQCCIHDDGHGFNVGETLRSPGLGLLGVRERLSALNGSLQFSSEPGQGTTLTVEIPLGHVVTVNSG